ncbi:serine/threonine-protein kinase RsbT [Granulicella aggregans]|jgi:serine/threonine-protein kinase RsbT|uniref:Serine/threonine-protein kinase RsbT n=1 Tax=Granulicella aggregans TaxID=474949 RepID=A0A7W7ZAC4_9BACT|nr:anti-sigma regulatory factor [Granulicella aggregans]MBB5056256.1 serine/threonine-protein kinase RsbT [Granulicella aggregans]
MALKRETYRIDVSNDVVRVRQVARSWAAELKFSLVDQTKFVTATSELARNTLEHGGGGTMTAEIVENGTKKGIRLIFDDQGPGIANIELALRDGYTSAGGMGLGLSGSKRLVNEFEINSEPGRGTTVTIIRWK